MDENFILASAIASGDKSNLAPHKQLPKDINEKFAKCINMNHQLLVAAGMSCTALDQVHFHSTSIYYI